MADFDDMNATPLGKLPMPVVQSKGDAPRVDGRSTSYEDLLKEMRQAPPQQQPPLQPQLQPQLQQPQPQPQFGAHQFQPQQPQPQPQFQPPQFQPQYQQPQYQQPDDDYEPHYARRPRRRPRPPPPPPRWAAQLAKYKSSLLVAVVVFLVLLYAAPRLAQLVPRLVSPASGRFNVAGIAVIAVASGGVHRLADQLLCRFGGPLFRQ